MKKSVSKKVLGLALMLAMLMQCFCGIVFADVTLTGDGSSGNPYQIGTYEELVAFRDKVNGGETGACAILTADIDMSQTTDFCIGKLTGGDTLTNVVAYSGTFDGNGHRITNFSQNVSDWYAGFFKVTDGATIINLTIEGSVTGVEYTGGLIGIANNTTITNCKFKGNVTGSGGTTAGFIGRTCLITFTTTENKISKCVFEGNVTNSSGFGNAAGFAYTMTNADNSYFVGDITGNTEVAGVGFMSTATNCFAYGTLTATNVSGHVCRIAGTATNCYYLNSVSTNLAGSGTQVNAYDFASGKIAYQLGAEFGQTIGTDDYPVFRTNDNEVILSGGDYINEGGEPLAGYTYKIDTYAELAAFRNAVNAGDTSANAILTADIDISAEANWTPIAAAGVGYSGTFDGNGHKITGFKLEPTSSWKHGFFKDTNGATIKNLTIEGNVNSTVAYAGGFVGSAKGTTITDCKFIGDVKTSDNNAGGFIGYTDDAAESPNTIIRCAFIGDVADTSTNAGTAHGIANRYTTITDSYVVGDILGCGEVAGISMWSTATNCFVYGTITATNSAYKISHAGATNCYFLNATAPTLAGQGEQMSDANFASGQVAFLLGEAFGQTIGEDLYPVFATDDNAVIKTAVNTYTNDETENGTTVPYTIKNYIDLAEFRNTVNLKKAEAMSASVKLTNDIAIPEGVKWTPIGTWAWNSTVLDINSNAIFSGTFDGDGHKITNVIAVDETNLPRYCGFFRQTDGAIIKNLTIEGEMGSAETEAWAGGLIGTANNTTITNCKFIGNVTAKNMASGFIGSTENTKVNNNISNCAFIGNITGGIGRASGFAYSYTNIKNSYYKGDVTGKGEVSAFGLYTAVENCFAYGTVTATGTGQWDKAYPICTKNDDYGSYAKNAYYLNAVATSGVAGLGTQATTYEFASGKIAYLLNAGAGEIVFGQDLETDLQPVFFDNNMVYQNGAEYGNEGAFATIGANGVYVIASTDTYVMVAKYAKEGNVETLLSVTPVNLTANEEYETAVTAAEGVDLYKVFVWNSATDMKPVCFSAEYEV